LLPEGYRYCAFISYSHADAAWARWVHHGLETYAIPANLIGRAAPVGTVPARLKPVFRDRDELPAAAELGPQLEAALRDSVALIVLCSPHSAKSRWVNEEVLFFKRLGRAGRVFPLIVGGEPGGGEGRECFPPGVRAILNPDGTISPHQMEPLAADAQPKKDGMSLALLKIIAGLTGLPLDELRQREQQRRQKRLALAASVGLALASAMTVLAVIALQQRQAAVANEHRALVSEDRAKKEADRATTAEGVAVKERDAAQKSERRALASEDLAKKEATRATAAEAVAVKEREATRRALADSQMSLAEAALNAVEPPAMVQALDSVQEDLRDQRWHYLSARRDTAVSALAVPGLAQVGVVVALPGRAGQFVVAGAGGLACVDAYTGTVVMQARTTLPAKAILAVTSDARHAALTSKNSPEIRLFRLADGGQENAIPSPTRSAQRLVFSPDGNSLFVLEDRGDNKTMRGWLVDARDGTVRWSLVGSFVDAVFTPDGRRILTATVNFRRFLILDAETGQTLQARDDVYPASLALSPDGRQLALGLYTGEVALISPATGEITRRGRLHAGLVERVAWTARGHLLTFGAEGKFESGREVLRLWNTANFSAIGTFFGNLPMHSLAPEWDFEPLSGFLVTTGSPPQRWRIMADLEAARVASAAEQGWGVAFPSESVLLARTEYELSPYRVTDPRTPQPVGPPGPGGSVAVAVYPPGGLYALASRITNRPPFKLGLYHLRPNAEPELQREIPLDAWTTRLDFDAAGARIVAVGMNNQPTLVVDMTSGERLLKLPVCERAVFNAAGDRLIAIVPRKRAVDDVEDELVLFDARSGQRLKTVTHHFRLNELVASPDRQLVALGGADKLVHVLDADTLAERWSFRAHDTEISALAFQPGQRALVSAAGDGTAKLWDYETARLRATLFGFDGTPVMAAFSPGGRLLAVESQDHSTRLFDLPKLFEAPEPKPELPLAKVPRATGDWQDLIAALDPVDPVNRNAGWSLANGVLKSPTAPSATAGLTLRADADDTSYQLRLQVRRAAGAEALTLLVPWGERLALFQLDNPSAGGYYTHLGQITGRTGQNGPGVAMGRQILDAVPHVLELTFQVVGPNVRFAATLDGAPLCEWSGALTAFGRVPPPSHPSGAVLVGARGGSWEILEAKLRRL
jgi:WD40 repeat protein